LQTEDYTIISVIKTMGNNCGTVPPPEVSVRTHNRFNSPVEDPDERANYTPKILLDSSVGHAFSKFYENHHFEVQPLDQHGSDSG
jgi:hypothetical protein